MLRALIGPTASGKEGAALLTAPRIDGEILSLDSMKLYRGMDLGTAKASPAARARVPHHLLDLASPRDPFSTRRWLAAAEVACADIRARGRTSLYVGGTALYLKALLYGIFEGPEADPELRARLRALPGGELHHRLTLVDPATAEKVHPNDLQRLVRALEVHELTGRPISELRREWDGDRPGRTCRLVGIRRAREDLFARIDLRVDRMLEAGLVDEVAGLLEEDLLGPTARQALGYKEIADYLEGRYGDLGEAVAVLKSRTRGFARRQTTWFKHFDIRWIDTARDESAESIADRAEELFRTV